MSTAVVAGCSDQDPEPEDEPEGEEGTGNGQEREGDEPEQAQDDEEVSHEDSSDSEEDEAGNETDQREVAEADSWEEAEEVFLTAEEQTWVGQQPAPIEGEENPTLELTAGQEYEIGYENRDGDGHTLAIWAGDDERNSTDVEQEEGGQQWLTVEATEDLEMYRCEVHPDTMMGDIEVTGE